MGSMYTEDYLATQTRRQLNGYGPITPGTYLQCVLSGKAKDYTGRYLSVLIKDLKSRPDVIRVDSVMGKDAYIQD